MCLTRFESGAPQRWHNQDDSVTACCGSLYCNKNLEMFNESNIGYTLGVFPTETVISDSAEYVIDTFDMGDGKALFIKVCTFAESKDEEEDEEW